LIYLKKNHGFSLMKSHQPNISHLLYTPGLICKENKISDYSV
jgi:hypothetical protein